MKDGEMGEQDREPPPELRVGMPCLSVAFTCVIIVLFACSTSVVVLIMKANTRETVDELTAANLIASLGTVTARVPPHLLCFVLFLALYHTRKMIYNRAF